MQKESECSNVIHGTYGNLLFDERWRQKRLEILERDRHQCVICGSSFDLQVHHKQYHIDSQGRKYVPWDYDSKYLITVCQNCHRRGHTKYEVPIFEIK